MFQPNTLSKLYPHLNFGRIPPPSATILQSTIPMRSSSTHSNRSVTIETKPIEIVKPPTVEQPVEVIKAPEIPILEPSVQSSTVEEPTQNTVKKIKRVKITEPIKPIETSEPILTEPKIKSTRPNRTKVAPMPEPERDSVIPVKGEQGLQSKYSLEQRKNIYLARLSRKSICNAEKEIAKVNEVLEGVEHDAEKLKKVEREVKCKLKLINYAKYFTQTKTDATHLSINETPKAKGASHQPPIPDKLLNPSTISGNGRGRCGVDSADSSGDSDASSDSTEGAE